MTSALRSAAHHIPGPTPPPAVVVAVFIRPLTRAEAITAGLLHPIPADLLEELRIRFPVEVTDAVWRDCVAWTVADIAATGNATDQQTRLADLLWALHLALFTAGPRTVSAFLFDLDRLPRHRLAGLPERVQILARVDLDDNDRPVLTLMWPHEAGLM